MSHYEPKKPLAAVIFDCDGTLSFIEGIDELARTNHVGSQVQALTAEAMGHTGINPHLYQRRLDLVLPTRQQVELLGQSYFQHKAPDVLSVIQILKKLGKVVYVVSAGLFPAVASFAKLLEIDSSHVFAVNIYFDSGGHYLDFDRSSPLVHADGKRIISQQLKQRHAQLALIGDGLNDYDAHEVVTRFVGYGGAFYRENIKQKCQYYIAAPSMLQLLPLTLTSQEVKTLSELELTYYDKGLSLLESFS